MARKQKDRVRVSDGLDHRITVRLTRANAGVLSQAVRILKKTSGLSVNQWRLMTFLDDVGAGTISQFRQFGGIDKATLSRTAAQLQEMGFLEAQPSDSDNRQVVLRLTEAGQAALEKSKPAMAARHRRMQMSLSAEELATFFAALEKIERATQIDEPLLADGTMEAAE